jgi:hypothetical protein
MTEARIKREAEERAIREEKEQREREANKAHRGRINSAAVAALVGNGIAEDVAKSVIVLIAKGSVPHVTVNY